MKNFIIKRSPYVVVKGYYHDNIIILTENEKFQTGNVL